MLVVGSVFTLLDHERSLRLSPKGNPDARAHRPSHHRLLNFGLKCLPSEGVVVVGLCGVATRGMDADRDDYCGRGN